MSTEKRRIEVFFYGLFMDLDLLQTKGVNPLKSRSASVRGFSLRIGQRATLVPDSKGRSFGMLVQLTHDELDRLYSDPSVQAYRAEPVMAELNEGSHIPALCFNLPFAARSQRSKP